jgi:hypothetical protein
MAAAAQAQFGSQPVGIASTARAVTVTATAAGTAGNVNALTMGAAGLDFVTGAGASTCGTATFSAGGQTCTEYVAFTPMAPGVRMGAVELVDAAGRVLGITYVAGVGMGSLGVLVPGNELTAAGNGVSNMNGDGGYSGHGGLATGAELNYPHAVAVDFARNMCIPDMGNNRVREVAAVGGAITAASTITTLAGTGAQGNSGDGGPANQAGLWGPSGVVVDAAGNLLIADTQCDPQGE